MSNPVLVIATKEIKDMWRDRRALLSSILYTLIGPIVVGMFALAKGSSQVAGEFGTILAMASVFVLLSGFTGGMNLAMDILAGERERRSLLPLLLNPTSRLQIIIGKWLAVCVYAVAAVLLNIFIVGLVLSHISPAAFMQQLTAGNVILLFCALIFLALMASAGELAVSTFCRTPKEAHTWLALMIVLPMVLGMFQSLYPHSIGTWCYAVPVLGQQVFMSAVLHGKPFDPSHVIVLLAMTGVAAVCFLRWAGRLLHRDAVVYGQ